MDKNINELMHRFISVNSINISIYNQFLFLLSKFPEKNLFEALDMAAKNIPNCNDVSHLVGVPGIELRDLVKEMLRECKELEVLFFIMEMESYIKKIKNINETEQENEIIYLCAN